MFIKVRVKTGQRIERLSVLSHTQFSLAVREKPQGNVANDRIVHIFRERFHTKRVRIISGIHSPVKMLSID